MAARLMLTNLQEDCIEISKNLSSTHYIWIFSSYVKSQFKEQRKESTFTILGGVRRNLDNIRRVEVVVHGVKDSPIKQRIASIILDINYSLLISILVKPLVAILCRLPL